MTRETARRRAPRPLARWAVGGLSGLLAGYAALAVGQLAAGLGRAEAGPVAVVGGVAIDLVPTPLKTWAIREFGSDDKRVLELGILGVLALLALVLGALATRWRLSGAAGVLAIGAVGAAAALSRPDSAGLTDTLPSLVGAAAGAVLLYLLVGPVYAGAYLPPWVWQGPQATWRVRGATAPGGPRATEGNPGGRTSEDVGDGGGGGDGGGSGDGGDGGGEGAGPGGADRTGAGEVGRAGAGGAGRAGAGGAGRTGADAGDDAGGATGRAREPVPAASVPWDRRRFVLLAAATAAGATGAGAAGRALAGGDIAGAVASREAIRLPRPDSPARPVPAGARLHVPGLSPFTTPNKDFYRVDTALVVPHVDADSWRLRIHGEGVREDIELSFADLVRRETVERDITLTCVSNEVGGPYVGNARWLGVPLAPLLREAGVRPPSRGGRADQLVARSVDGMTLGTPVEDVMDGRDALLAFGMNGEPLPFTHGFPVRMVVPGLYGYVSACKWIESIELTTFAAYDPYWVRRDWAREGPIKTSARIDTPKPFARPKAGTVTIAGVAWAQHRGIEKVEVRVDDGRWRPADLAAQDTRDTWRQWSLPWRATPGTHTLTVRATDGEGHRQTAKRAGTVPDGASGWHAVVITVD
ncbi:molybdopterin-dependent oxidoreductase [Streptomyces sp. CA-253872]|uniref:molybdopterin-dependent oxidoreductase n=1 Tax=Streptomyces sp. CA-253872 TaxID=3240067 RepID=UPI003D91B754